MITLPYGQIEKILAKNREVQNCLNDFLADETEANKKRLELMIQESHKFLMVTLKNQCVPFSKN